MRSSSITFFLLPLLLAARAVSGVPPPLGGATAAFAVDERLEHHPGVGREEPGSAAFYLKVGKFAVWIYSLHHGISPVLQLERVVSAATRPSKDGRGVEYLLVLRVVKLGTCEALVWGVPGEGSHEWKLKEFKQVGGA